MSIVVLILWNYAPVQSTKPRQKQIRSLQRPMLALRPLLPQTAVVKPLSEDENHPFCPTDKMETSKQIDAIMTLLRASTDDQHHENSSIILPRSNRPDCKVSLTSIYQLCLKKLHL